MHLWIPCRRGPSLWSRVCAPWRRECAFIWWTGRDVALGRYVRERAAAACDERA
jgi:hypothetical protein